jgi:hypothetical protein
MRQIIMPAFPLASEKANFQEGEMDRIILRLLPDDPCALIP